MNLGWLDLGVVAGYALVLILLAWWVSREPKGETQDTGDYFLAGKMLPWWAIGASLIAANISSDQIIGQSGQGFAVGLAIAAYEWQAAIVLLIVAKFFLPIFLDRKIHSMPHFLDQRFGSGVKTLMSVYWIGLYTAVNLTTVLWLGGLAVSSLTGWPPLAAMAALAGFAALYSLYGGLKAVALTDIVQVVVLIFGGLVITWLALDLVGVGGGPLSGLSRVMDEVPGHFRMILSPGDKGYGDLPGLWTLLGGLWVLHFSYWGFNQYIIQRALGAQSLGQAQKGLVFAAFLKFLIPVIVVLPGIAAVILAQEGRLDAAELSAASDRTYGELMTLTPEGLRGLIFAALIAAIVSSLASMMNSVSTIFTLDLYQPAVRGRSERHYVGIGRIAAFVSLVAALALAQPFLGGFESAFQTVQEYSGFIAPGVVALFLLGLFWPRANAAGAFAILFSSILLNIALKFGLPDLAFIIRIWFVFLGCLAAGIAISLATAPPEAGRAIDLRGMSFRTDATFNVLAVVVVLILIGIYAVFW